MDRWEVVTVTEIAKNDQAVQKILDVLAEYRCTHEEAQIDVRRRHEVSIHIRIIDPDFRGLNRVERQPEVWKLLKQLPDEVFADITMLLLLTLEEAPDSLANFEFEHPIRWEF
jgi:stress-induced morphogen